MEKYVKIEYLLENTKGTVLINENIKDEEEIKQICLKDYLDKLSNKVKIIREEK